MSTPENPPTPAGNVEVTGPDGTDLATEATQLEVEANTTALASTVRVGTPIEGDAIVGVAVRSGAEVIATISPSQTASAQPADDATGIVIRDAGLAPKIAVGEEGDANPVVMRGVAQISGEVSQGRGAPPDTADPWIVKTSDGVDAKEIATREQQDAQTALLTSIASAVDVPTSSVVAAIEALGDGATIAQVVSRLDTNEVTQAAILAELQAQSLDIDTVIGHLANIETSSAATAANVASLDAKLNASGNLATEGKQDATIAAVQAVEAELQDKATDATAQAIEDAVDELEEDAERTADATESAAGKLGTQVAQEATTAKDATLTNGSQRAITRGGAKGSTAAADVTSTAQGTDHQALDVQSYHGGTAIDPRQVRALTAGDIVTATQGAPAAASLPWSFRASDGSGFISLALDVTLTNGSQIAVAKGPIAIGAAVGSERPVLVGGNDDTNARMIHVDSTGAVRLQSGGTPGATSPGRTTQVGGTDGTNLRTMSVDSSGRPNVNIIAALPTGTNTIGAVTGPGAVALATQATLAALLDRFTPRPTFMVHAFAVAPANLKSMMSLAVAGGGPTIALRNVMVTSVQGSAISGQIIEFQLRRFTSHSAGTTLTAIATGNSADALSVSVTARTGATIAGEVVSPIEHPWEISADEYASGAIDVETFNVVMAAHFGLLRQVDARTKERFIAPGEGLHILCNTNTTAGSFNVSMLFTVEP